MSLSTEALFIAALGLQAPWRVERAELSTAKRRIDFDVIYTERRMSCPHCGEIMGSDSNFYPYRGLIHRTTVCM